MVVSMTQDEIIGMAKKCGWDNPANNMTPLYEFAKLVAQHEREACAKVCDVLAYHPEFASDVTKLAAMAIRARKQA
jgi:hypothetical protein